MSKNRIVRNGERFKDKEITFAPTDRIEMYEAIAAEFMQTMFDFETGDYLITDESDLRDFNGFGSADTTLIWNDINQHFGIVRADVGSERLVDIFAALVQRRSAH